VVVVKQTESLDIRSLGIVNATERTQERLVTKNIYLQACLRFEQMFGQKNNIGT